MYLRNISALNLTLVRRSQAVKKLGTSISCVHLNARDKTSNLPQKPVDKPKQVLPKPLTHAKLSRFKSEFHGVLPSEFNDETKWHLIFLFPYAKASALMATANLYVTIAMGAAAMFNVYHLIMNQTLLAFGKVSLCALSLGAFMIIADDLRKLVCMVYSSEDHKYVRLARITFRGRRRDMILPVASLTPLSEINRSWRNNYLKIKVNRPKDFDYDNDFLEFYDETFKLTLRYGGILDFERFGIVFGRILRRPD